MPLPKTSNPLYDIEIPSLNRKIKFRPYLHKEEKILLMAGESDDDKDLVDACRQIINNCCQEDINVESLPSFDLEYIFIQLRRFSVNNVIEVAYRDLEDEKIYKFEIDLSTIELTKHEGHDKRIQLTDNIIMLMKYPTITVAESMLDASSKIEMVEKMIIECVDKVFEGDTIYESFTAEELAEFLDGLTSESYDKIKNFFDTMPSVNHTIEYVNSKGTERKIQLSGLRDFFTFWSSNNNHS